MKKIHYADSIDDLEDAAKMFAKVVTDFGVELFIGLLTRGAGKMRAKPGAGGGSASGAKPKTKSEIEADNKAKADAAKKYEGGLPTTKPKTRDEAQQDIVNQMGKDV